MLETANRAQLAGFVKERYSRLEAMLQMVEDVQWDLSAEDRQRTLNALACFGSVERCRAGRARCSIT